MTTGYPVDELVAALVRYQQIFNRLGEKELQHLEGLLEQAAVGSDGSVNSKRSGMGWKKKAKQIIPHFGLVFITCFYAIAFSFAFYYVEGPEEQKIKRFGLDRITADQELIINMLWARAKSMKREEWFQESIDILKNLTTSLYHAHESELLTAADIKLSASTTTDIDNLTSNSTPVFTTGWTIPAAIFFSATTMTTIGYGNLIPTTLTGRVICVVFALIGTPLAIITIGDVGKFMSEYTIRLYKNYKKVKEWLIEHSLLPKHLFVIRKRSEADMKHMLKQEENANDIPYDEEEDDIMKDKTAVPVVMVFSILLVYTALGAVLFAYLETWSYVDAFYFCFITLTTVGFGDLVPEQTKYLWLMLMYISVGLVVTTMCIDLVGIQYIQKIHYFGRKFQGADLLTLLKRRKIIERRLALAAQQDRTGVWLSDLPSARTPSILIESPKLSEPSIDVPSIPIWPVRHSETPSDQIQSPLSETSLSTNPSIYERIHPTPNPIASLLSPMPTSTQFYGHPMMANPMMNPYLTSPPYYPINQLQSAAQFPVLPDPRAAQMPGSCYPSLQDSMEDTKLLKKRERNREAATRCRRKKITMINELRNKKHKLEGQVVVLREKFENGKKEIKDINSQISMHEQRGCCFK